MIVENQEDKRCMTGGENTGRGVLHNGGASERGGRDLGLGPRFAFPGFKFEPAAEPANSNSRQPYFVDWNLVPASRECQVLVDRICDEVVPRNMRSDAYAKLEKLTGIILVNLAVAVAIKADHVFMQLSCRVLDRASRCKPDGVTRNRVCAALDALVTAGVATVEKGGKFIECFDRNGEVQLVRKASMVVPTRYLEEFRALDIMNGVARRPDEETVILRIEKADIQYEDSQYTRWVRSQLGEINEHVARHPVIYHGNHRVNRLENRYARIYNDDFERGGRLYGHFAQHLHKGERRYLQLDSEPVADLDYEAMHLGLLYVEADVTPQNVGDPFIIPGFEGYRDQMKRATYAILNAKKALNHFPDGLSDGLPKGMKWRALEQAIFGHIPLVEEYSYQGVGLRLTRKESDIMMHVLMQLVHRDIGFIPFHDGVMVPESKAKVAEMLLLGTYEAMTGRQTVVKLKPITKSQEGLLAA